ncbi:hypothetical protein ES707_10329 [subsurface metagenome]
MIMKRTQTIEVAYGVLDVSISVSPTKGYVGYWVKCMVSWMQNIKILQDIHFDWGDGRVSDITNHSCPAPACYVEDSHNYQTAKHPYTITVTVTDAIGRTGSDTATVEIADKLTGFLNAAPTRGDVPLTVTFEVGIDKGYLPYSWVLDFKDGTPSETGTEAHKTVEHTYMEKGRFVATLTVTDALGASMVAEAGIGVGLPPLPELAWWQWGLLLGWVALGGIGATLGRKR